MARKFTLAETARIDSSLLVGIMGPPSSGKTYSAYELAVGMQSVTGGDIGVIDTEAGRALHYIEKFRKKAAGRILHMPFEAPFAAIDYVEAIHHCADQGCKVVIIDSASHSHDGPGGLLEQHAAEVERLSRGDASKADGVSSLAWTKPKQQMRRMATDITTTLKIHAIFCFRAQSKLDWKNKERGQPRERGWIPIGSPDLIYEFTVNFLLNPQADGMPDWEPQGTDAGRILKWPEQFRDLLVKGRRIDAAMGAEMARWAKGNVAPQNMGPRFAELLELVNASASAALLEEVGKTIAVESEPKDGAQALLNAAEVAGLKRAYKAKRTQLGAAT